MDEKEDKNIKVKWVTVGQVVLILAAAYLVIVGALIAFSPRLGGRSDHNKIIRKTASIVPYPVALVGTDFITYDKLFSQLSSVQKFYESQDFSKVGMRVDFSTQEGRKRLEIKGKGVLGKLIDDRIIQAEANKVGIRLGADIIDQEVDRKLKEYGTGEALKDNLDKLYGWDIADFKENIVKPDLYQEKMIQYLQENDPTFKTAKNRIIRAQEDLKNGMEFAEAAAKHSEGESAKNGGELGWFSADQMIPAVAISAFQLDTGKQSEIIQSSIGYHIVKIEDKKTENDVPMVKLSQVFVRTKTFSEWLKEQEKNYRISIFSREFIWNGESQMVEFRSRDMVEYEKNVLENPPNDPSIIF